MSTSIDGVFVSDLLERRFPAFARDLQARLAEHRIGLRRILGTRDIWCRDYMPVSIGGGRFMQFRYAPDYLHDEPELITRPEVANALVGSCTSCGLVIDGGNIVRRARTAVVTDKIFAENPSVPREQLVKQLRTVLEVERLAVIPVESGDMFGHADGVLHLLDERTALVNDYTKIDPDYGARLGCVLREHGIEAIPMPYAPDLSHTTDVAPATGVYVNLLETAEAIFVPAYGIRADEDAVRVLTMACAGRSIVPIDCRDIAREGGSLHCVTWEGELPMPKLDKARDISLVAGEGSAEQERKDLDENAEVVQRRLDALERGLRSAKHPRSRAPQRTMGELQEMVSLLLTPAAVRRYDVIMRGVADAGPAFDGLGKLVHRRIGAQFRVSTGRVRRSNLALEIDVRVAGTSVGTLHITGKESRQFEPHKRNFRSVRDWDGVLPWLDSRVAKYIDDVAELAKMNTRREFRPEARVEASFVDAFDANESWTRNIELVRIGPLAYQVPVPVGGSEKAKKTDGGLGYIDALCRFGRGHGLRVFELKKPSATVKEAVAAVRQAATYALTLKLLISEHRAMGYRRLFNFEGKVRDSLRFVASPVVPLATRSAVEAACAGLVKDGVDGVTLKPLFFEWDQATSKLTVGE